MASTYSIKDVSLFVKFLKQSMTIELSCEKHKCSGFKSQINPKRKIFLLTCNPSKGKSHTREKLIRSAKWPPTAEVGQMSLYFYTISAKRGLPFYSMADHSACTKTAIPASFYSLPNDILCCCCWDFFPQSSSSDHFEVIKSGQKLNSPK